MIAFSIIDLSLTYCNFRLENSPNKITQYYKLTILERGKNFWLNKKNVFKIPQIISWQPQTQRPRIGRPISIKKSRLEHVSCRVILASKLLWQHEVAVNLPDSSHFNRSSVQLQFK